MPSTLRVAVAARVATGVAAVGLLLFAVTNWPTLSRKLLAALEVRSQKASATLFRLGELASIETELKAKYGVAADLSYETSTGARVLRIAMRADPLPERPVAEDKAREIAAFAITRTAKAKHVDVVEVTLPIAGEQADATALAPPRPHRFDLAELASPRTAAPPESGSPAPGD